MGRGGRVGVRELELESIESSGVEKNGGCRGGGGPGILRGDNCREGVVTGLKAVLRHSCGGVFGVEGAEVGGVRVGRLARRGGGAGGDCGGGAGVVLGGGDGFRMRRDTGGGGKRGRRGWCHGDGWVRVQCGGERVW